jgi:uncharacterized membrane protein
MSDFIPAALDPIVNLVFGIAALLVFARLLLTIYHGATERFTGSVILQIGVLSFIFVICLDWVSGFNFFKDKLAPFIWNILNGL